MTDNERLIEAIRQMVNVPQQIILGEAVSYDEDKQTADIKLDSEGKVTYTIRLKSVIDNEITGFVVFPAQGSNVLAAKIYNDDDYIMITCSKADKVWLRGRDNEGLININDFVKRINELEKDVKYMQDAIRKWTPVAMDGGASLKTYLISLQPVQNIKGTTNKDYYEDTKVVH